MVQSGAIDKEKLEKELKLMTKHITSLHTIQISSLANLAIFI